MKKFNIDIDYIDDETEEMEQFENLMMISLKKINFNKKLKNLNDLYNIVINKYDYIDGEIINIKKRKFDDRN